ncbi:MAG: dihydrofolate reductase [Deltaproteobacteria bacterium]|nr:MAG: dihydrofolate reductase [Deltaproteobacteria bacterium]
MSTAPTYTAILAADLAGGIARGGDLPWHLPADLRYFKQTTVGDGNNAVIMGRATWESIPPRYRPLPRRRNIVISRNPHYRAGEEALTAHDLDAALAASAGCDAIFVVGGAQVYAQAFADPRCRVVLLTRIEADFGCDTRVAFPVPGYHRVGASERHVHDGVGFTFERWERG